MSDSDGARLRRLLEETARDGYLLSRCYPPTEAGLEATTYFGATPRLPQDAAWPAATDGRALNFLAQIDLAGLPPMPGGSPLPAEGTLFFFADICHDRGNFPEDRSWAAVRYMPGSTASVPMRPAPPELLPLLGGEGYTEFAWGLSRDPMGSDEPNTYPFWPIEPSVVRTYADAVPDAIERYSEEGHAYEKIYTAAQAEAFAAVVGSPAVFDFPTEWKDGNRRDFDPTPMRIPESGEIWLPDDLWPYAWVHVRIHTAEMLRKLAWTERQLGLSLKNGRVNEAEVAEARALYARAGAEAEAWYARGRSGDLVAPVPDADRAAFTAWLKATAQPRGPDWFKVNIDLRALGAHNVNRWTAKALMQGTDVCLGYAAPEQVRCVLPPHLLDVLRPAYAPCHISQSGVPALTRHQLLGVPARVQSAPDELGATHHLLAQFEYDEHLLFYAGDVGVVQFWITPEDLGARRFDHCVVTADGH